MSSNRGVVFCLSCFFLFAQSNSSAQIIYSATNDAQSNGVNRYGEFVINALLLDMGLSLSDEDKSNDEPDVSPEPDQEESFFSDDGFFNDELSFDEIVEDFDQEFEEVVSSWDREYEETVARWESEKEEYNEEKEQLVDVTYDMTEFLGGNVENRVLSIASVNLDAMSGGDYHVIPYAFNIDIRNQVGRGTCAAFAGVRAIETVLWQHVDMRSLQIDLSEQHFYWLSKSSCQSEPCSVEKTGEGTWSDYGFELSQRDNPASALMLEKDCPYNPYPNSENISYTPLDNCRFNGLFRTKEFKTELNLPEVIGELSRNRPVVAGFTLTNSYMDTRGLVRARDPKNNTVASGEHVPGHAMVLIGYIKLPEKYWGEEGRYCSIVANSWGGGFGVGGYACLTEQWMKENQFRVRSGSDRGLFTSVTGVQLLR